jgi:hypothetical protein
VASLQQQQQRHGKKVSSCKWEAMLYHALEQHRLPMSEYAYHVTIETLPPRIGTSQLEDLIWETTVLCCMLCHVNVIRIEHDGNGVVFCLGSDQSA